MTKESKRTASVILSSVEGSHRSNRFERMRTVLVIGSNAFSGSHCVDQLLTQPEVFVVGVSRSPEKSAVFLPYKQRDLSRFAFRQVHMAAEPEKMIALLDEYQPEAIINYAALNEIAPSHDNAPDYFATNCVALAKMCTALRMRPYLKRYVHISTPEVYGNCEYPLPETAPWNPSTPYAVSKTAADMYLLTLFKNHGFPVLFTRATNYYGAYQQLWKLLPRAAVMIKRGKRLPLHGGGVALKTWIHVRDATSGVLAALERGRPGEIYHFSDTANVLTVAETIQKLCEVMGVRVEDAIEQAPARLGQDARYLLNYEKAERELGWKPERRFADGLSELVSWMEGNWEAMSQESSEYVHRS